MQLGMIGMGRMGANMSLRLLRGNHSLVVYDQREEVTQPLAREGAIAATSPTDLVGKLNAPRVVWVMVPSGDATETIMSELAKLLHAGDIVVDGGNSYYKDSTRRAAMLKANGISMLDVGTSGGIWGLEEGYSLMVGGDHDSFSKIEPVLKTLAPSPTTGYGYVGPSGAGHFVKMVHNGIEYGLMQAYAEGFELMKAKSELAIDLAKVAEIWRYGSVVRSWLLDLIAGILQEGGSLEHIEPYVADTGEGRWTVKESIDLSVPTPVITQALQARFRSQQARPFGPRLLAALRNRFGGHAVRRS